MATAKLKEGQVDLAQKVCRAWKKYRFNSIKVRGGYMHTYTLGFVLRRDLVGAKPNNFQTVPEQESILRIN